MMDRFSWRRVEVSRLWIAAVAIIGLELLARLSG